MQSLKGILIIILLLVPFTSFADQFVYPTPFSYTSKGSGTGSGGGMIFIQSDKIYFDTNFSRISDTSWTFPIASSTSGTTTIKGVFTNVSGSGADLCRVGAAVVFTNATTSPSHVSGSAYSTTTETSFEINYYNSNVLYRAGFFVGNATNESTLQNCDGYITEIAFNGTILYTISNLPLSVGSGNTEDVATTTVVTYNDQLINFFLLFCFVYMVLFGVIYIMRPFYARK